MNISPHGRRLGVLARTVIVALLLPLAGLRLSAVITFGGALSLFFGMLAWWLAFYAAALIYVAFTFPWQGPHGFVPPKED